MLQNYGWTEPVEASPANQTLFVLPDGGALQPGSETNGLDDVEAALGLSCGPCGARRRLRAVFK